MMDCRFCHLYIDGRFTVMEDYGVWWESCMPCASELALQRMLEDEPISCREEVDAIIVALARRERFPVVLREARRSFNRRLAGKKRGSPVRQVVTASSLSRRGGSHSD